ncbi:MAG: ribonuclease HII [Bacilli bacterium]|jgi:ribonuclease HII
MLTYEKNFYSEKIKIIVGVDEAGRGPLCGPVVAGACILPMDYLDEDINDSKKLSAKKREIVFKRIVKNSISYGIGYVSPKVIDEVNIYEASRIAMIKAISNLRQKYDLILTDAMPIKLPNIEVIPIIKGDAKCECIAAGSILAKVCRDHYMEAMAKKYPEYKLEKNKGYPTKEHVELLNKYGPIKGFYRYTYNPVKIAYIKSLKII